MEHNSTFPIKQSELDMLRDEATSYLKSVQWEQGQRAKNKDKDAKMNLSYCICLEQIMEQTHQKLHLSLKLF